MQTMQRLSFRRASARIIAASAGLACFAGASSAGLFPASATWNLSGTGDWETGANWTGGDAPNNDGVLLWTANVTQFDGVLYDVNINSDVALSALNVDSRFADVEVLGGSTLKVSGPTTVTAGEVRVTGTALFDGPFTAGNGAGRAGFLTLFGGEAELTSGMDITDGGIFGHGTLNVTGGNIENDDQIRGATGGTLMINLNGGTLDLDGATGNGQAQALLGNVQINGGIADAFNGSIQMGNGWGFGISDNWTLTSGGVAEFISGTGTLNGGQVNLIGTGTIRTNGGDGVVNADVAVNGGTVLAASGESLTLNGGTTVNGGSVTADGTLINAGTMALSGGTTAINASGQFYNEGTVLFNGGTISGAGLLRNNNGTLDFVTSTTLAVGSLDLDGQAGGDGKVIVRDGVTATIDAPNVEGVTGGFNGMIDLRGGELDMDTDGAWSMASGSTLLSWIAPSQVTSLRDLTLSGDVDVQASLSISAPNVTFGNTGLMKVEAGQTLNVSAAGKVFEGAQFIGDGRLSLGGTQSYNADTTFDVALLDWDGIGSGSSLIADGVQLTINSQAIDLGDPATDGYDANVILGVGSILEMNTASEWRLDGDLTMGNQSVIQTSLARGAAPMGRMIGDLNIAAGSTGTITGPFALESSSLVTIEGGETLRLADGYLRGATITGAGTLFNLDNITVESNQVIDVETFDMDGSGLKTIYVNNGASLTINSDFLDAGSDSFGGYLETTGTLTINNLANQWENAGVVNLQGGALDGVFLTNSGLFQGHGDVMVDFDNTGSVRAVGGTLVIDDTFTPDYDGSNEAGELWAQNGSIQIVGGAGVFNHSGLVRIGGGNTFDTGGLAMNIDVPGELLYISDGTYMADAAVLRGVMNVNGFANATHEGDFDIQGGSVSNINGDWTHSSGALLVRNGATVNVNSGGSFTAEGASFTNSAGSTVMVDGVMNLDANSHTFAAGSQIDVGGGGTLNFLRNTLLPESGTFLVNGVANADGASLGLAAGPSAFTGSGELRLINGGSIRNAGVVGIDLVNTSGIIDPSFGGIGQIGVQGDFTQSGVGSYFADLTAGASDRIVVTGNASLGGSLEVYRSGFTPQWGDEWEVMSYASVDGDFDVVNFFGPSLDENLFWYTDRTATAYLVGVRDVADVNHDGVVDFSDLNAVLAQFGGVGDGLIGDANEDGLVDFTDVNTVLVRFGLSAPMMVAAVPAPGAAALFGLAATVAGRRRRRA